MSNLLPRIFWAVVLAAVVSSARADVVLQLDINHSVDTPDDTPAGFAPYYLSDETLNIPPFSVDVNPAGGAGLVEFHRATPVTTGTLTLGAVYRDGLVADAVNSANFYRCGMDAIVSGLIPGKQYALTAWAYDSGSTGSRVSDWAIVGMGGPQFVANNFSLNGSTPPANDTANQLTATARADENGRLTLRGRQSSQTSTAQVFLNGFTLDELPGNAAQPETLLALDFNQRGGAGATNTQTGFTEFLLSGSGPQLAAVTRVFGAYSVTLTPVSGAVDDRLRTHNDAGAFTDSRLLRDFIFGTSTAGMDVKIEGLPANQPVLLELWSFDILSTGSARTSDWTVNGATLWDDYTFNGANVPSTNDDYRIAGTFTTNSTGELLISGRLVAGSPAVFLNALRISQLGAAQAVDFGKPVISEFLAVNESGITDEDGDASDWIEIWNTTASAIDFAGWRLTDNPGSPARWSFPANVIVPSQARLIVWASGKNRTLNPAALHTNFGLQREAGGYLALSRPDGTIVSAFTNLPAQIENTSYGVAGTSEPLSEGFFAVPTPNAPNGTPTPGFVADTTFDFKRGYYIAPFNVHVACATPGAQIYYTTDGSEPTAASTAYPGAAGIPIATTTVLRVKAFASPLTPSNTDTQTYIFRDAVVNQPAAPAGWPSDWGFDSEVGTTVPSNYEMDPAVTGTTQPGYSVSAALSDLPALSVVLPPGDFLGGNGIYSNPRSAGDTWERACSLELIELDGSGFNTSAGIRVHGNSSRRPARMQKHSFRLSFRAQYGDGRLNYRLFDDTSVARFNKLVLHAFFTDGWGLVSWDAGRYRPWTALAMRDAFMKRCFAEMGHARVSGRYAHLYINGLYWGIYRIGERIEDDWAAGQFGGLAEDWDVIAFGEGNFVRAGTSTAWNALFSFANGNDLSIPANYQAIAAQLDVANFIDYYLLHVHGDSEDWPHHNGYAIRDRVTPGAKWKFVTWDQELAFDPLVNVDRYGNNTDKTPGRLLQTLRVSPEFRLLFADRAHKHLHNTGALSVANSQARWQSIANLLDKGIVAESARWGDTAEETPYGSSVPAQHVLLKRETHWLPQMQHVRDSHIPALHNRANSYATITELAAQSLWPSTEPPVFAQFGGAVPVGYALAMNAPAGSVYYTLDGSDPREAFTGNIAGTLYTGPVALPGTLVVKARARNGATWSALTEATFIVGTPASSANLAVTELRYNPQNPDHEFIELANFSSGAIDLTGVHFEGITYTIENGTVLAPGEHIVVARNSAAFTAHYGSAPRLAGQYSGALDNNGENLAVIAANGDDIVRFRYDDDAPWPRGPVNGTHSIVLRSPSADPSDPINWRLTSIAGGSPGAGESVAFTGDPLADVDKDGLAKLLEYALGTSDTVQTPSAGAEASVENHLFNGIPTPFLTLTVRVATTADGATLRAELSQGLSGWDSSPSAVVYLGETYIEFSHVIRKWRAAVPLDASGEKQFFRVRATLP